MIDLIAGTILLGVTIVLFLLLRWGANRPQEPAWLCETLVANLYMPVLIGTLSFGAGYLIRFAILLGA